jgi:formate hydrogenlyase subunit 3/multisubunit Na+/H+ antiporter MnhD subunit
MNQFYSSTDHFVLVPAVMLALFGCAILLFDFLVFPDPRQRKNLLVFLILGEGFAGFGLWNQQAHLLADGVTEYTAFHGALVADGFSIFFNWIFIAATVIVAIVSYKYLEIEGEHHAEYYSLMMFAQCGMFFLAAGTDLVTLFVGLELMALSFYVMVGFLRTSKRSNEAAMKYLLLGAFSSGFLAYGFSVMYGICYSSAWAVRSAGLTGAGHDVSGLALQNLGSPVSHVGAGRIRRCAHHCYSLSFGGIQGGIHRVPAAHLPRSAGLREGCLGANPKLYSRRHHDSRQLGRHQSEQHQAPARI